LMPENKLLPELPNFTKSSGAKKLAWLPLTDQAAILSEYSAEALAKLLYDWKFWGRPNQLAPPGNWRVWLLMAGRGFGKTRTGAEYVRARIDAGCRQIGLVAPTAADARDVMVRGESGLLSIYPPNETPIYQPSNRRVTWANGAEALLFSADEPERLRGVGFLGYPYLAELALIAEYRYDDPGEFRRLIPDRRPRSFK
jgi:Terminase large subunit, T4likevirus-type, N-terminal